MLIALQPLTPGDHLLEAGCGIGATSVYINQHGGCAVTGITLSPVQVTLASHLAARSGKAAMQFVSGD